MSPRKRILATGGDTLLRIQQPDSTVISEPSFKEKSSFSCDTFSVLSSSSSVPVDLKKPPQIRRSSVISLDYDSDRSDSIINVKALHSKDSGKKIVENESICDSPSTHSFTKTSHNFSKNTHLDGSDLFFSPKRPEAPVQNKSKNTAATDIEPDDFYIDDFDIDDFNDSDIPDYFDKPQSSSASRQNSGTVTTTVREGGSSKSSWENKPATPPPAPKPSKISSPGKSAWNLTFLSNIFQPSPLCNELICIKKVF